MTGGPAQVAQNNVRTPGSATNKTTKTKARRLAKVKVKNFERRVDKLYVNGKETKVDVFNTFEVKEGAGYVVRVETPKREHFVAKDLSFRKGAENIVEIEPTPEARFGYLMTSRACFHGSISFELYGENRVERVPIGMKPGIRFPTDFSEEVSKEKEYEVFIQKGNSGPKKSVRFTIREFSVVDLCKLI
ncbi:hypothetical protein M901_1401 [Bacteriovorax sp. DB6_IX]|nr:hypothetical protein M901_1401 [Bacteriovorax sp. DB6_IX]